MNCLPEHRRVYNALLITLLMLCVLVYLAGLGGGFLFDDFHHIVNNPLLHAIGTSAQSWLAIAMSSEAGILRRPVSMLSFGLNVSLFGMSPFAFKVVNLFIHLVNGALIYAIGRRIADRLTNRGNVGVVAPHTLALLAAGLWLLHPLNVSGVVYIVQRMNELCALFTLAGLLCYVDGRVRMLRGGPGLVQAIAGLCICGVLAVLSKENGALILAYALVVEALCFRFEAPVQQQRLIKAFFWLGVALPPALFAGFLVMHPHWLSGGYDVRDFSLYERVLSEARILCDYLLWIFVPLPAWMGIYHDDIATSTGIFNPISTLFALVFLIALVATAWKLRWRSPGFVFGVAWFLAGHAMESTILPLELVFEHRNYLPMAGLLLGIVCTVAPWLTFRLSERAVVIIGVTLVLTCGGLTAVRAGSWGDPLALALTGARNHPDSSRSQYEAGRAIVVAGAMKGERARADLEAEPYYIRSAMLDKNQIAPATELMLIQASRGPVTQSSVDALATRLQRTPTYTQANPFMDMLVAASEKKLSLTAANFSTLVEAALDNPHFPPKVRAMIMNNFGAYQFNIAHDPQGAVSWTLAAAAEDPNNPYFQINLAQIALAVKQPGKAKEYLDAAKQLNKLGIYDQEIDALQQQISKK